MRTEPTVRIVFYFALFSTVVSAVPAAPVWVAPDGKLWLLLVLMGGMATTAQLFLTRAYRESPAAEVGPFIYMTVVFAGVLDWALWRILPDALFLAGAAMVCLAGGLVIRSAGAPATAPEGAAVKT
jgi:drug/metabolite transporter (DMT)-like permease